MVFFKKEIIILTNLTLVFFLGFISSTHATPNYTFEQGSKSKNQREITAFFKVKPAAASTKFSPITQSHVSARAEAKKRPSPLELTSETRLTKQAKVTEDLLQPSLPLPAAAPIATVKVKRSASVSHKKREQPDREPKYSTFKIERIVYNENHINELLSLIYSARKKLEIFSWSLSYLADDIYEALTDAADRGIEVILTVNKVNREETLIALEDNGIQVNSGRKTHTKFAMADDHTAMIGSYNFLGGEGDHNDEPEGTWDSSFKITHNPDLITRMRRRIYYDMIRYEREKSPLLAPLCVNMPDHSRFYLLTNLTHHQEFFRCMMQGAQKQIVIYSPFVNANNAVEQLKVLEEKISRTVSVLLHVTPDHFQRLNWALSQCVKLKGRVTIKTSDFHRKSMIIDSHSVENCFFCEGSFNWLSAATQLENETCNQETSIVLTGAVARKLLNEDNIDF